TSGRHSYDHDAYIFFLKTIAGYRRNRMSAVILLRRKKRFDFRQQFTGKGGDGIDRTVLCRGLGDIIGCTLRQRLDGDASTTPGERTAHDDLRLVMTGAQLPQDFKSVHSWHFNIEKNQLWLMTLNGVECADAVTCHSHQFNGWLRCDHHAQEAAHDKRVVYHKDTNGPGLHGGSQPTRCR